MRAAEEITGATPPTMGELAEQAPPVQGRKDNQGRLTPLRQTAFPPALGLMVPQPEVQNRQIQGQLLPRSSTL